MQRDIRKSSLYREAESLYDSFRRPGSGLIVDAAEITIHGSLAAFTGTLIDSANETLSRICLTNLSSADTRVLTFGPNTDRSPKFSPDGRRIAFLSDRKSSGHFQLYLLDPETGECHGTTPVDGWVEYLHWSPNGRRILIGVAGRGTDLSGAQNGATSDTGLQDEPAWTPTVDEGRKESYRWRRAYVYELDEMRVSNIGPEGINIWESAWCDDNSIVAIVSPAPNEGLWYTARLITIETQNSGIHDIYAPQDQLGWPRASPSGHQIAVIEGLCSDRWIVKGDVKLIDLCNRRVRNVETRGIDVAYAEWRSEKHLLLVGYQGLETVISLYEINTGELVEIWRSRNLTTRVFYACSAVAGIGDLGDCVLVGEGFLRAPEIAHIRRGKYEVVRSLSPGLQQELAVIGHVETVTWQASDGLEIQGLVLKPAAPPTYPTVLHVHGGPVGHHRSSWLGRSSIATLMLLRRGFAVFLPNPRGSAGRGQAFARSVLGDMGGADANDCLSGLDHLIDLGIADPLRLGIMGGSYGGYMAAWLITQDPRFAAAVAISPFTNYITEHLLSNVPHFVSLFLKDTYLNPRGKYFERSPIMHAHKARTPLLSTSGTLDRCTPPEEAAQFHNALLKNGVKSVLITYPQEGHGVRKWPATVDFAARTVGWFDEHMLRAVNNSWST